MAHIGMVLIGDIRYDGRVRKEISSLVGAGHQVELVVSDFSKGNARDENLGVKIHYVPMTSWNQALMNFFEQLLFNYKVVSILKKMKPTHIHCNDLNTLLSGVWMKHQLKASLVFDAHELMPESQGGVKEKIWRYIEKVCVKKCDHIIMPEKNRIAYFKRNHPGVLEPLLLENFPKKCEIPHEKFNIFREIYPIREQQKIILSTGHLSPGRYIEELIDSMTICNGDFALVVLGKAFKGYDDALKQKIYSLGLADRVFLHQPVRNAEILRYMASCDIGTAFYRNTNLNNYYCASNKIYEYIALDKLVLTNNYPGLKEHVEHFGKEFVSQK